MKSASIVALLSVLTVLSSCSLLNINSHGSEADDERMDVAITDSVGAVRDTTTTRRRLPTLREQMQRIEEHQAAMQEDIEFIKNDLSVLKEEVVQLRNAMTSGKPAVTETEAVKGPRKTEVKDEEPAPATMLLPDEEVTKAPQKKPVKPQGAVQNATPRQTTAPVTIPSDEQVKASTPSKSPAVGSDDKAPVVPSDVYKEAMQYVAKKEYDKAVPLLEDVLKNDKNPVTRGNAWYWLGEASYAGGDYDKAIEHFREAFAIKSSTKADDALLMMAESYRKMGKTEEARKTYNKLIQTYPQSEFVPRARKMLQML